MKWNEWFVGFDFEPYGKVPMSWEWVSLWKWLEMSENENPYQIEWNRWDMNELKWIEWIEGFEGFDFVNPMAKSLWVDRECPYQNDLSDLNGNLPMSWEWVSLSKWLEWSLWECSYQNDQNRWDLNELKWIERLEVKWVIWRIWLCEPYGNGPMV